MLHATNTVHTLAAAGWQDNHLVNVIQGLGTALFVLLFIFTVAMAAFKQRMKPVFTYGILWLFLLYLVQNPAEGFGSLLSLIGGIWNLLGEGATAAGQS